MSFTFSTTTNIHLRIIEIVLGFIVFAWGAFSLISWISTSEPASLKFAAAGLGFGCLLWFDAHRAGKRAARLEEPDQNQAPDNKT